MLLIIHYYFLVFGTFQKALMCCISHVSNNTNTRKKCSKFLTLTFIGYKFWSHFYFSRILIVICRNSIQDDRRLCVWSWRINLRINRLIHLNKYVKTKCGNRNILLEFQISEISKIYIKCYRNHFEILRSIWIKDILMEFKSYINVWGWYIDSKICILLSLHEELNLKLSLWG